MKINFNYCLSQSVECFIIALISQSLPTTRVKNYVIEDRVVAGAVLVSGGCVAITNCGSRLILGCPVGINAKVRYFIVLFILRVPVRIIIIEDGTLHNAATCASTERAHTVFFPLFKFTFSVQLSFSR